MQVHRYFALWGLGTHMVVQRINDARAASHAWRHGAQPKKYVPSADKFRILGYSPLALRVAVRTTSTTAEKELAAARWCTVEKMSSPWAESASPPASATHPTHRRTNHESRKPDHGVQEHAAAKFRDRIPGVAPVAPAGCTAAPDEEGPGLMSAITPAWLVLAPPCCWSSDP